MRVAVVLLTWQRISSLKLTLDRLMKQTYRSFDIHITNANLSPHAMSAVEKYSKYYMTKGLRISVSHDGNDAYAFRRFTIGRLLAEQGYEVIMFIDDDVTFPTTYISRCLDQYEPESYKSGFAWVLHHKGISYYKHRTRVYDNNQEIHYCGTGFSMIDASIFLDPGLIEDAPIAAYKIEDLWLSYYAQHIKGWKLAYMNTPGVTLGGADSVALYKQVQKDSVNKTDFLKQLVERGWNLPD